MEHEGPTAFCLRTVSTMAFAIQKPASETILTTCFRLMSVQGLISLLAGRSERSSNQAITSPFPFDGFTLKPDCANQTLPSTLQASLWRHTGLGEQSPAVPCPPFPRAPSAQESSCLLPASQRTHPNWLGCCQPSPAARATWLFSVSRHRSKPEQHARFTTNQYPLRDFS